VWFNNHINVNSIKVDKLEKTINDDGTANLTILPFSDIVTNGTVTTQGVTNESKRDKIGVNTILFTTFTVSNDKSVDAYYFNPQQNVSDAAISIYRKTPAQTYYDFVCELTHGENQVYDYNIRSNSYYHYLVAALIKRNDDSSQKYKYYIYDNKENNSETYIKPKFNTWSICNVEDTEDENVYRVTGDVWNLGLNIQEENISINYGISSQDTLGRYSKFTQGAKNYSSATFSGLLGNFESYKRYDYIPDNGVLDGNKPVTVYEYTEKMTHNKNPYAAETEKLDAWIDFCTDGELKLLRDVKGNAWLIQISEAPSYSIENLSNLKQTMITFSWKEAEDVNAFSVIGLE
jgi:hypothetical protein